MLWTAQAVAWLLAQCGPRDRFTGFDAEWLDAAPGRSTEVWCAEVSKSGVRPDSTTTSQSESAVNRSTIARRRPAPEVSPGTSRVAVIAVGANVHWLADHRRYAERISRAAGVSLRAVGEPDDNGVKEVRIKIVDGGSRGC
jgi:hypothetical protein